MYVDGSSRNWNCKHAGGNTLPSTPISSKRGCVILYSHLIWNYIVFFRGHILTADLNNALVGILTADLNNALVG